MKPDSTPYHYCFDANGNVGQLVNTANGEIAAHYEFDPFGNVVQQSGSMVDDNPFRFSTKYTRSPPCDSAKMPGTTIAASSLLSNSALYTSFLLSAQGIMPLVSSNKTSAIGTTNMSIGLIQSFRDRPELNQMAISLSRQKRMSVSKAPKKIATDSSTGRKCSRLKPR